MEHLKKPHFIKRKRSKTPAPKQIRQKVRNSVSRLVLTLLLYFALLQCVLFHECLIHYGRRLTLEGGHLQQNVCWLYSRGSLVDNDWIPNLLRGNTEVSKCLAAYMHGFHHLQAEGLTFTVKNCHQRAILYRQGTLWSMAFISYLVSFDFQKVVKNLTFSRIYCDVPGSPCLSITGSVYGQVWSTS